ncbi:(deoxy)nucleoside triphosphate pyrophosphohydrolase [Marinifilum sp. RC60d5]|uniref:(deoxy)nucleoside triphosphate pyrophosphohydrolase n=1 Tax=Marinifilum sp. RC60d5 TaxID=3458414 RepID=UPI004035B36C
MNKVEVTAAIIRKGNKILAAQRSHADELSGKWEFPGGKIEANESPEECIVRELNEEFGINTKVSGYLGESVYDYENKLIFLKAFYVEHISGEYQIRVHENIRWIKISELKNIDWAPADIALVKLLLQNLKFK